MVAQAVGQVKTIANRLDEARETRAFVLRQIRWCEANRNLADALEWHEELRGVEREIRALATAVGQIN